MAFGLPAEVALICLALAGTHLLRGRVIARRSERSDLAKEDPPIRRRMKRVDGDSRVVSEELSDLHDRVVRLFGVINDELANEVIARLLFFQMNDAKAPITLEIDSVGGNVTATLAIVETMAFVKCPVATLCRNRAMGCAAVVFACGARGSREAGADAMLGFTKTTVAYVSERSEVREKTDMLVAKVHGRLVRFVSDACRQPDNGVAGDFETERHFTAEEATAYGLADRVLASDKVTR